MKVTQSEEDARARVSNSLRTEIERRVQSVEATLREKELENANLRQKLDRYEKLWSEIPGLEAMWRMQMTSLQQQINDAKQSLGNQEGDSSLELKLDDTSPKKNYLINTPRGSRHILPHNNDTLPHKSTMIQHNNNILQHNAILPRNNEIADEFDWDETTSSVDSFSSDHNLTSQKTSSENLCLSSERRDVSSDQLTVSKMRQEFEHRTQVFMDDAEFLKEVKSGQTEACLNPDEELSNLKESFNAWTKDFKYRLKNTKGVLQKLGNGEPLHKKRNWWNKRKVLLQNVV